MGSTSQPRPLDNHHKAAGATTTNNHHVGAPVLSKMIRQDLIMMKEAMAEVQKKTDHINVQINQVCERFEVLETRGGNETQRELGELKNDVKKLKSQIPSKLIKVNPADSQPRRNPWLDGSINHNSNQDNINKAYYENMLHSLHKDAKFDHIAALQQCKVSVLGLPLTLRNCLLCFLRFPEMASIKKFLIYWWIGEGFLPPNPEDQKTKSEIALGKTEEDFGNEILGELIAKDFIEPIYKNCSLVTNSYRMLPFIHSALTIMAERFGFSPVYTLGSDTPTFAQYNEYKCLLNVGAAIIDGGPKLFSKMNHFKILYLGRWQRSVTHHIEVADAKILHGLKKMNQLRFLSLRGISLITELPQFISRLTSLKILDLKACHNLELVPNRIGLLKNLTHLDMSECYLLEHMPKGIGSLSQLQVLKGFIIGDSTDEKSCTVDDLTKLTKLRKLSICMSITTEFSTSKQLGLGNLETLQKLKISWPRYNLQGETDDTPKQKREQSQPRSKLTRTFAFKELHFEDIMVLPSSLQKLELVCFPKKITLGHLMFTNLKNLKKLYIIGGPLSCLGP
ncbi:disease resistance RPP13-like protein 4 [Camellia sinensis]|uniref:disease resistance RPP13-like protein 4 n=1 Tax=Camellia sinensis TaxID=4442 RepID=UPI0010366B6D|nr:disease resistance RPP13-like protein 4 [Camellia sinensis]